MRVAGPIANALRGNTTLTALALGDNNMGGEGQLTLALALATNTTLLRLDLAGR